jgi:hypothetical protein
MMLYNGGSLPQHMIADATRWLARADEEERQREIASRDEQSSLAREQSQLARTQTQLAVEQKDIARRTLLVTWIAVIAAIAALVVACLAWLFPRT